MVRRAVLPCCHRVALNNQFSRLVAAKTAVTAHEYVRSTVVTAPMPTDGRGGSSEGGGAETRAPGHGLFG